MSGFGPGMPAGGYPAMSQRPGNGFAVTALVLGIFSIVFFCVWYFAQPCGLLAIIFGALGRGRARSGASGGGMATAGMICGILSICLFLLLIGLVCAGFSMLGIEGLEHFQQLAEEAAQQGEQNAATQSTAP